MGGFKGLLTYFQLYTKGGELPVSGINYVSNGVISLMEVTMKRLQKERRWDSDW